MGTGGLNTQDPCRVESILHDVKTCTVTQDTTILQSTSLHFYHFLHDVWQRDIYNLLRNSFLDALLKHRLNHLHCLLHCLETWDLTLLHNFKRGQK